LLFCRTANDVAAAAAAATGAVATAATVSRFFHCKGSKVSSRAARGIGRETLGVAGFAVRLVAAEGLR
jgi:hypothetical protein